MNHVVLMLVILMTATASASVPYQNLCDASGTSPLPNGDPTNPALFQVTPFLLTGLSRYRVMLCANTGTIQGGSVRLWLWDPAIKKWSENFDLAAQFNPVGDSACTSTGVVPDIGAGYLYPQVYGASSSASGATFTVRVTS